MQVYFHVAIWTTDGNFIHSCIVNANDIDKVMEVLSLIFKERDGFVIEKKMCLGREWANVNQI